MSRKTKAARSQPTLQEFLEHAHSHGINQKLAERQWILWDAGDWCDGNNKPIKNWKLKLGNYAEGGFGAFRDSRPKRNRSAESDEEYEQRQRYKPKDL